MQAIKKHKFEAMSLLTTQSGSLDVTIVPVVGQPNWLLPTVLILDIVPFEDRIWNFIWQDQDVAVYHLLPKEVPADKIIVLEGNTAVHRLALQVAGELENRQLKILEVQDALLPEGFIEISMNLVESRNNSLDKTITETNTDDTDEPLGIPFVFQAVKIDGEIYVVPDVDLIAHQLVDLDS